MMNKEEWANRMIQSHVRGEPKKVCSNEVPGVDLAMAYEVQAAFGKSWAENSSISGFKAALTAKAAQESMGLKDPASGILFEEMQLPVGSAIQLRRFNRAVIETEIGFCVGKEISQVIEPEDLGAYIGFNLPMIEIADIGFDDPGSMSAYDFIAGNAAAAGYIAGHESLITDVNEVEVTLSCDGDILHKGKGSEVLGDQVEAATWLVNQVIRQGYIVKPDQLLMTGSLGRVQMVTSPGAYVADYGDFGKIEFQIV
jgi:2-keto-4-pentenoate hydratase